MSDEWIRDALFAALDNDRGDTVSLAALGDWFEEHGEPAARECLLWVVQKGRRPGFSERLQTYGKYFWEREGPDPILADPDARLPESLWLTLVDNDEPYPVGSFKSYQSARAAYLALIAAWKRKPAAPM